MVATVPLGQGGEEEGGGRGGGGEWNEREGHRGVWVEEVYIYMHWNPLGNEKWEEMGDSLSICIYIYIYIYNVHNVFRKSFSIILHS